MRRPPVKTQRRRTLGVDATRVQRRHLGHVTVGLSTCRRHEGPKQPNILVTNGPETGTAREIVGVSLRRWWIERLMKERTGVVAMARVIITAERR